MPSKGYSTLQRPVNVSTLESEGVELVRFDTDHFKTQLYSRIRWPAAEPGAWLVHDQVDEGYCRQVVAEEVILTPSGKRVWVDHGRPNHFGDCEVLCLVAARTLSLEHLPDTPEDRPPPDPAPRRPDRRGSVFERFD